MMRTAFVLFILAIVLVGCKDSRPDRVPVSGKVLIDGKPLSYGFIQFLPTNARASRAKLDDEGRFTLSCFGKDDGAVIGKHTIVIIAGEPLSGERTLWHAPKKYTDSLKSGLTQQITGPMDNVVVNVSWDGGKPFIQLEDGSTQPYLKK